MATVEIIQDPELEASNQVTTVISTKVRYFHFSQVPRHLQDNDAIHTGYRAFYNFRDCVKSVFALHNETGNIWTHLLGSLFFVLCMAVFFGGWTIPKESGFADYLTFGIFFVSAIKCLLCSCIFHILAAHSHAAVYHSAAILDYSGISMLIFGSFLLYINYGLYCYTMLRYIYISISALLCLSGVILPWFRFFRRNNFRTYRTLFFVGMGAGSGLIALHTTYLNGWTNLNKLTSMNYYVAEVIFYLLGAVVYVQRIPERWFPGKLDHWFHSHQLWHILVWGGALFHYKASLDLMNSRLTRDTCCF